MRSVLHSRLLGSHAHGLTKYDRQSLLYKIQEFIPGPFILEENT